MPDFTVVIPTRNRARRLRGSAESVLAQVGADLELIVVDDGSSDDTPHYLGELASRDERVRVIRNAGSVGAAVARNQGAAIARAPLLAFNDDDCVWRPDKLQLQHARMQESGAGVVYCREAILWPDIGLIVNGKADAERRGAVRSLVVANYIGTYVPLIERRLFEEAGGFDARLPRLQDWDLWLRLGLLTSFAFVPRTLVHGEAVEGGISQSSGALSRAAELMLEKWIKAGTLSKRDLALLHYGVGKFLLADGNITMARRAFRGGLRIDPSSPRSWTGILGLMARPWQINLLKRTRIHLRRRGERAKG